MLDQFLWGHSSRDCDISCFRNLAIKALNERLSKTSDQASVNWPSMEEDDSESRENSSASETTNSPSNITPTTSSTTETTTTANA